MAAFVQSASGSTTGATTTTIAITPTAGNALLLGVWNSGASTTVSASDTKGNTWSTAVSRVFVSGVGGVTVLAAYNVASGATTITITATASAQIVGIVHEVSGLTASGFDVSAFGSSTTGVSSISTGSTGTTAQASEYLFGFVTTNAGSQPSFTDGASWTSRATEIGDAVNGWYAHSADQLVSSTGTYSYTSTPSVNVSYYAVIATFKAAAVAFVEETSFIPGAGWPVDPVITVY